MMMLCDCGKFSLRASVCNFLRQWHVKYHLYKEFESPSELKGNRRVLLTNINLVGFYLMNSRKT